MGWTALIWAAKQGYSATVKALMAGRADISLKDYSGRTAPD